MAQKLPMVLLGVQALGLMILANMPNDAEGQFEPEYSYSLSQANRRRTVIYEVNMVPAVVMWKGVKITVGQAWLEKRRVGGCYLCFHLKDGREAFTSADTEHPFFVLGEKLTGVKMHVGRGWMQFVQPLDSEDLSNVRFSLIGAWKETRPQNIRFVRRRENVKQKN